MGIWSWRDDKGRNQQQNATAREIKKAQDKQIERAERANAARRKEGGRTITRDGRSDRQ